jgi:hypothetical protein
MQIKDVSVKSDFRTIQTAPGASAWSSRPARRLACFGIRHISAVDNRCNLRSTPRPQEEESQTFLKVS